MRPVVTTPYEAPPKAMGAIASLTVNAFGLGLSGLIVLNYGFQMIRVPPSGAGVPLMEILMFAAAPFVITRSVLRDFSRSAVAIPLLLWLVWGGVRVLSCIPEFGMKAVRDGLPVLESTFLVFGFAMASKSLVFRSYLRWMPYLIAVIFGYALLAPFASLLQPLSPTLPSTQGIPVPILFMFGNSAFLLVPVAAYLWVRGTVNGRPAVWTPAICIGVALVLFPSRSLLLMIGAMIATLLVLGGRDQALALVTILAVAVVSIGGIVLLSYLGVTIAGRLGQMNPEDYLRLARELMIWERFDRGTTISSGGEERIDWWLDIINRNLESASNFVFGVGYGEPLMDGVFHGGKITREPHNSWVSVFGRSGIFGLLIFVYLCIAIVRVGLRQLKMRSNSTRLAPFVAFCMMMVACTLVLGLGETPFVMPFIAIPYYFCAGLLVRMDVSRSQPNDRIHTQAR